MILKSLNLKNILKKFYNCVIKKPEPHKPETRLRFFCLNRERHNCYPFIVFHYLKFVALFRLFDKIFVKPESVADNLRSCG